MVNGYNTLGLKRCKIKLNQRKEEKCINYLRVCTTGLFIKMQKRMENKDGNWHTGTLLDQMAMGAEEQLFSKVKFITFHKNGKEGYSRTMLQRGAEAEVFLRKSEALNLKSTHSGSYNNLFLKIPFLDFSLYQHQLVFWNFKCSRFASSFQCGTRFRVKYQLLAFHKGLLSAFTGIENPSCTLNVGVISDHVIEGNLF